VASGQLAITDDDVGESFFNAATVPGAHGSLTITPDGAWTYEVDNALPEVQGLAQGEFLTDTVTVTSQDGTAQDIEITIKGSDDFLSGTAIDGYIEGATIFADTDGDGELDAGEAFSVTGEDGEFSLTNAEGSLVLLGGDGAIDAATGLAFNGQLEAPAGSTVVTPLTTLINKLVEGGEDQVVAQAKVKSAFGITAGEDLTTFDPIDAALSGGASAASGIEIAALGVALQNLAVQAGSALRGASDVEQGVDSSLTFADATDAVFRSLSDQISVLPPATELQASQAQFEDLLVDAAVKAGLGADAQDHLAPSAGDIANVMLSGLEALDEVSADPIEALRELAQTASVLQHEASSDIEAAVEAAAGEAGDVSALSALLASFTGEALEAAIEVAPTGNVLGSHPVSIVGTDGDDVLIGGGGDDTLIGLEGRDTLIGSDGNDTLDGGLGQDTLSGGAGDDVLISDTSRGADLLDATGSDFTSADYRDATGPITVTLSSESSVTGDVSVGTDTLIGIDRVFGSDFDDTFTVDSTFSGTFGSFNEIEGGGGDDVITGNGSTRVGYLNADAGVFVDLGSGTASSLEGDDAAGIGTDTLTDVNQVRGSQHGDTLVGGDGEGFESFRGQAGDDFIDGGGGVEDRADYKNSPNPVHVDLSSGIALDGFGGADTLVNIERVRGSGLGDLLIGSDTGNRLEGKGGDDTLIGGEGDDSLRGGDGDDTLEGGVGQDFLSGGSGSDAFVFTSKDGSTRNLLGENGFFGDVISDYTAGEDQLVFEGMEGISYTGRVFEVVNGDPHTATADAIDADPSIQNEIVFILDSGPHLDFLSSQTRGFLYVKGVGSGADFDQMMIELQNVSVPPPVDAIVFSDPDAVITGDITATLTEDISVDADDLLTTSGQLSITDADAGEAFFNEGTISGAHGSLTITPDGSWSYTADNAQPAVQGLGEGALLTDTVTVTSLDGTEQSIEITITGTNDVPIISGELSGSVVEDEVFAASGQLSIADVDGGEAFFNEGTVSGAHGSLTIDANGAWTYKVDNDQAAVQALGADDVLRDTVTVTSLDGTEQSIEITISGKDEPASVVLVGTDGDEVLIGDDNSDTLIGLDGRDTLIGHAGDDTLDGGLGQDTLVGGAGDDLLTADTSRGLSTDFTSVDYRDATGPITVTLSSESRVTGDVSVGTDTLIGIDRVFGSGFDDTFTVDSTFSGTFGTF
ncbi:MAG: VCBS domain-containing protein, partial [Pseudomonadota bacterium]|nr:VCBS domain-containing protein [Pseudomonadota bacterium]